jgi:hypothetical protein
MDHVVYVDAKADEMGKLLEGGKRMIIRGAAGRKMPYGRVNQADRLFFIANDGSGLVKAKAQVANVHNSEKMTKDESITLVENNQEKLILTGAQYKRWAGKRYLVLIEVDQVEALIPFRIDRSAYGNMDDWLPVGDIETVKLDQP